MDKREFLDKWIPYDKNEVTQAIKLNYMLIAMEKDLDALIEWAAENVIKGAKGDNRVFVEEKKEEEKWVASAKLRWGIGSILQQEWRCLSPTAENGVKTEWRDVPFE
jgi:hypothetical protein